MHKICILLYCILSKICIDLLCIISIMKSSRQKVLITEVRIIIRMEASELKQKKYTYMERLGALLYSANRMNTYMGRVTDADRHCLDVLRDMEHWAQETRQQTGRKQSGFLPVCCLPAKCRISEQTAQRFCFKYLLHCGRQFSLTTLTLLAGRVFLRTRKKHWFLSNQCFLVVAGAGQG